MFGSYHNNKHLKIFRTNVLKINLSTIARYIFSCLILLGYIISNILVIIVYKVSLRKNIR